MSIKQFNVAARCIEIVPMGDINKEVISFLEMAVSQKFGLKTSVSEEESVPATAYDRARNQYNSRVILTEIEKKQKYKCSTKAKAERSACENETKYLAVVNDDLYTDGLNFVFGQAILKGCCAVISLARLYQGIRTSSDSDIQLFFSRIEKEAIHELGHVFGLRHCPNPECVMFLSGNLADTDNKSANFCFGCQ